jgi:hypothetical protein
MSTGAFGKEVEPTVVDSLLLKIASAPSKMLLLRSEMNSALVPFLYS